jgi:surface protein
MLAIRILSTVLLVLASTPSVDGVSESMCGRGCLCVRERGVQRCALFLFEYGCGWMHGAGHEAVGCNSPSTPHHPTPPPSPSPSPPARAFAPTHTRSLSASPAPTPLLPFPVPRPAQAALTDAAFKEASWDWAQSDVAATGKWGDIGDWDVTIVKDFNFAFSATRSEAGGSGGSNPNAVTVVGTGISKWKTLAVTSMLQTFKGASAMNADVGGWDVSRVTTLDNAFNAAEQFLGIGLDKWTTTVVTKLSSTFYGATKMNADLSAWDTANVGKMQNTFRSAHKFTGLGLRNWSVVKVTTMENMFNGASSLTPCNKRRVADAWASNTAFEDTSYDTDWAADTCPVQVRVGSECVGGGYVWGGVISGDVTAAQLICEWNTSHPLFSPSYPAPTVVSIPSSTSTRPGDLRGQKRRRSGHQPRHRRRLWQRLPLPGVQERGRVRGGNLRRR